MKAFGWCLIIVTTLGVKFSDGAIAQARPLRLGMIAPLTGDLASYGQEIKRGVMLAAEHEAARGIAIEIVPEHGCLPTEVRVALRKLIELEEIDALVANYCTIGMVASIPLVESSNLVTFQTSGATAQILAAPLYLISTAARTSDEALALADLAYTQHGAKRVAIMNLETQWGEEFADAFSRRFEQLGGEIAVVVSSQLGANNFKSEIAQVSRAKPDAILLVHLGSTLGTLINQIRSAGLQSQLLGTADAEDPSVIEVAGPNSEGLTFLSPTTQMSPEQMRFESTFKRSFGADPTPLARHAYDATVIAAQTFAKCAYDRRCAIENIYKLREFAGATGAISIEPDGGTSRNFAIRNVKSGHFQDSFDTLRGRYREE